MFRLASAFFVAILTTLSVVRVSAATFEERDAEIPLFEQSRSVLPRKLIGLGAKEIFVPSLQRWVIAIKGTYEGPNGPISFETNRGELVPVNELREAGTIHDIDICFKDQSGLPIYASFSGDTHLIEDCSVDRAEEVTTAFSDAHEHAGVLKLPDRATDFKSVQQALRALRKVHMNPFYADEQKRLSGLLRGMRRLRKWTANGEASYPFPDEGFGDIGVASISSRAVVQYRHYITMWRGTAFHVTPFHHSATLAYLGYSYNGSFWWLLVAWEDGNHGRHWYDRGMTSYCYYKSPPGRSAHVHHQRCSTVYDAFSVFGHNCNDDSTLQFWSVWADTHFNNATGYPCQDYQTNLYAPRCF